MTDQPVKPTTKLAGVTSFSDDESNYIAPPLKEVRDKANAQNEALGFVSDKPRDVASAAPQADAIGVTVKKRARQPSQYPDHYNLRLREGDRERFDDYAYRHRIPKGEAFRIMLDLAEAEERRLSEDTAAKIDPANSP